MQDSLVVDLFVGLRFGLGKKAKNREACRLSSVLLLVMVRSEKPAFLSLTPRE